MKLLFFIFCRPKSARKLCTSSRPDGADLEAVMCEPSGRVRRVDVADTVCWNLTINDRWSRLPPPGLCCSSAPLASGTYCSGITNNSPALSTNLLRPSLWCVECAPPILPLFPTHADPPLPTQSHIFNTQNKLTDSTPHPG